MEETNSTFEKVNKELAELKKENASLRNQLNRKDVEMQEQKDMFESKMKRI